MLSLYLYGHNWTRKNEKGRAMSAISMADELYTVEEIAKKLRITGRTVRRMIEGGQLRAILVRNQYRISQDALDAYIRDHSLPKEKRDN
jgi:excisionase family DNA binding protein